MQKFVRSNLFVFCLLWVVLFVLYLPASRAGLVGDFPGWLDELKTSSFVDYLNRVHSKIHSLYQFKQVCIYLLYLVFKTHPLPWHLLYITLQSLVCTGLFIFFKQLFSDSGIKAAAIITFCGVWLYAICPYNTEVLVWQPAFHYMQAFLLILIILISVQRYYSEQKAKFVWVAGIAYFLSTYTLEVFYLTPFLAFTLTLYYRLGLGYDKAIFRKSLLYFLLPQLLLFITHLIVLHAYYGPGVARMGDDIMQSPLSYLQKPSKYLFHLLAYGRFLPNEIKFKVYDILNSIWAVTISSGLLIIIVAYIPFRFRKMDNSRKLILLLAIWVLLNFGIILPMQFPNLLWVIFDRYTYFLSAFVFMLLVLLVYTFLKQKLFLIIMSIYTLCSMYVTYKVNKDWGKSADIIYSLLHNFPEPGNKTVVLLNLPKCYKGIQMINAEEEGQYKRLHNLLLQQQLTNTVYDGLAYNMESVNDGANVTVLNDSTIRVVLNQWGTWWWYGDRGGNSYTNADYTLDLKDPGHMYELTLKKPATEYMLLYQVGNNWHIVDWNKRNTEER